MEHLRSSYLHNALRNKTLWEELFRILLAFRRAGLPVIALKGAHLAELVYGDIALRPIADLDLLVREDDVSLAEGCLQNLGYLPNGCAPGGGCLDYARHHHLPPFMKPGAVPVEIHDNLSNSLLIAPGGLWERARDAEVAGVPVQILAPEDLILHLCVHAAHNHRFRVPLIHLCDIVWSVERYRRELNWRLAAAIDEEWGVSRIVYSTLLLVDEILGLEVDSTEIEIFQHEPADREIVPTLRDFLLSPEPELPEAWQELGEQPRIGDRLRALARGVFPPRERMRRIYGLSPEAASLPLYYLYRPFDLLIRRGRLLGGLIFRSSRLRPCLARERQRLQVHRWLDGCVPKRGPSSTGSPP